MKIVSTLEGQNELKSTRSETITLRPPAWAIEHQKGLVHVPCPRVRYFGRIGWIPPSFLFTGADMDYLALVRKKFRDMAWFTPL